MMRILLFCFFIICQSLTAQDHIAGSKQFEKKKDSVEFRKNLISANLFSAVLREVEGGYERLFFDEKLGLGVFGSRYIGNAEAIRGRRSRNYSFGGQAHYYFYKNDFLMLALGGGLEVGGYTNEQLETSPPAVTDFDPSKRGVRFTYYYGRLGTLLTPFEHFNLGVFCRVGSRHNRRRTDRDSFIHPHFELSGILRL